MNNYRVPSTAKPLHSKFIKPLEHFLTEWHDDADFYQDFIYCCPFNKFLLEHFNSHVNISTVDNCWKSLFKYFSRTYSGSELADLTYEAVHDLGKGDLYLAFLLLNDYAYMWPTGDDFTDPALDCPQQEQWLAIRHATTPSAPSTT